MEEMVVFCCCNLRLTQGGRSFFVFFLKNEGNMWIFVEKVALYWS